jgi:ribosomal protein S27E
MLTLCPECKNHYDDSSQTAECAGIGRTVANVTGAGSAHLVIGTTPIAEHVANVRRAGRGVAGS